MNSLMRLADWWGRCVARFADRSHRVAFAFLRRIPWPLLLAMPLVAGYIALRAEEWWFALFFYVLGLLEAVCLWKMFGRG